MGRARRNNCRLCMKQTTRGETTTINNLPKTFAHILEEISGLKFTEADGLHMSVCVRCHDFLQAMEHHSQYPKSNKISGAGKKKVRRLMDKGFSAAEAIEKVIAEKRARDLLAGTVVPGQAVANAPLKAQRIGPNAVGVPDENRNRLSGAQRRKLTILLAGGMDRIQARELVLASSRAEQQANQAQIGGAQRGTVQRGVIQRGAMQRVPGQRGVLQRVPGQKGVLQRVPGQKGVLQRVPGQRGAVQRVPGQRVQGVAGAASGVLKRVPRQAGTVQRVPGQGGAVQKATPQNGPAQRGAPRGAAAQKVPAQKAANGQKAPTQKAPGGQKGSVATNAAPQQKRQTNANGGRTLNSDKRLGAYVAPRRNERPAPYNINNNNNNNNNRGNNRQQNQRGQHNDNFNQKGCPLEVGIVPINFPNVQLDEMKLDALKEAITNEIFKIPPGGPLIRFLGTSSQNGWLKLICADELSHNWLSMLVARWERAGLRMVEGNSLPQPVVLSFYLPGDFRSPDEILNILERQNNSLNTNQWRVINRETDANGQSITVCVDEQSFQALQSRDFMVFLGLGIIELKPRRFPSDGGSFINAPMQGGNNNNNNNNRSNIGGGHNSKGYSNGGSGGGGGGNNYQAKRSNNSGGGGNYQRQGMGQGQNYQRAGYQSQRAW